MVGQADAGLRLDQFLARSIPEISRRQARTLLTIGGVFLDGRRVKTLSKPVVNGQKVDAYLGGALERAHGRAGSTGQPAAPPTRYRIVHEDEDIVVVDKPAGLLTAPTPESDRNNLADLLARRGEDRVRIDVVHRIDLQTSGLLVFAKTPQANRVLSEAFRRHDIERAYTAVVSGTFPAIEVMDAPLRGKRALTRVLARRPRGPHATEINLGLETGRTHQIRLHCRGVGCPVLGDPDGKGAGGGVPRPPRMALHAGVLGFVHPVTGAALRFASPLPPDLASWLQKLPET